MFLGFTDPNPLIRDMDPDPDRDPSIIMKNSKKNIDSYCFVTSLLPFIFNNDVNVPLKSNKQKNFFVDVLKGH
jgi:hypothetical protein